jgi:hypothetical protein
MAASAQDATKPGPMKMMAKDANPDWEVATVKPSDPNDTRGQHIDFRGRNVLFLDSTLDQFLLLGYGSRAASSRANRNGQRRSVGMSTAYRTRRVCQV